MSSQLGKKIIDQTPCAIDKLFSKNVRRFIPDSAVMLDELESLFARFKHIDEGLRDDDEPVLFLKNMGAVHERALKLLRNGHVSDPEKYNMYYEVPSENPTDACPHYITARGSSQLENFWRIQERIFTSASCGAEVMECVMRDFAVLWNLTKATRASGAPSFAGLAALDVGLLSEIQQLERNIFGRAVFRQFERIPDGDYGNVVCMGFDGMMNAVDNEAMEGGCPKDLYPLATPLTKWRSAVSIVAPL